MKRTSFRRSLFALGLVAGFAPALFGQVIVTTISTRIGDSISPAPVITIAADGVSADLQPTFIRLLISSGSPFQTPFLGRLIPGTIAQITMDSLLPQRTRVFLRAQLLDRNGSVRAERIDTADVRSWLRLIMPSRKTEVLFTRRPRFVWSSPPITLPPGPWRYLVEVFNTAHPDTPEQSFGTQDTTAVPPAPLDACTSYRIVVTARAENGRQSDQVAVPSPGTIVIQTADCPQATIFYQNFPNPFGRGQPSDRTCFWFDLAKRSAVRLTIYDIRMRPVKQLIPSATVSTQLESGAYGRVSPSDLTGCDPRFEWDGRDARGRIVPTGAYVAIFEADGKRESKKFLFFAP